MEYTVVFIFKNSTNEKILKKNVIATCFRDYNGLKKPIDINFDTY